MGNDAIELAVGLALHFEGFRAHPYLDPVGIATIGYGFTHYGDGRVVRITDGPILPATAAIILRAIVGDTARRVLLALNNPAAALTPGRLAALSDFAYNLGLARLTASSLWRLARVGRWDACPTQFRKWRFAGGKVLPGLVLRREAEITLLNS